MNLQTDKIKTLYHKFLFPSLGSAMVMSIYTMTDAIVVGKGVGSDALAALSIVTPPLCLLMSTGILFGVGGSIHMNLHKGMGNEEKASRFFTLSFFSLTIITLLLWLIYGLFTPQILQAMGATDLLMPYALSYMNYFSFFIPVALFSNYLAIFIRSDGDPNRAMFGVILGGITNIILDILFVFPMQLGIGGAAFASGIGMCVQVCVSVSHFFSKKNTLTFIRPHHIGSSLLAILSSGISSFINELANGVIVFLFNIQILRYCGNTALSVYSVISNCVILFNSLFTGVGQAIQPIVSYNYGAHAYERIKEIKKMAYTTIVFLGALFSLTGILFPNVVCSIFLTMNADLSQIANYGVRLYFLAFLPMGVNVLSSYYLQSTLRTKESLLLSLLRNIFLSGICILVFPLFLPANILWIIMPIVETIVFLMSLPFLQKKTS